MNNVASFNSMIKKMIIWFSLKVLSERSYLILRFFYKHRRIPDLDNPQTFSEKIVALKLLDIGGIYTLCADKYAVRDVVEKAVGDKYLIPLVARFTSVDEFIKDFDSLPNAFALKAAHGSGWNEIVFDKGKVDFNELKGKVGYWLSDNYHNYGREKQYKDIPPSIVVEKLLISNEGKVPFDFKFYCFGFGGEDKIIVQVDIDRYGNHERLFFDEKWKKSDISILSSKSKLSNATLPCPKSFDEMLGVVRKLSKPFNFSRIDLYELNGDVYFGEITFHPESGYGMYVSPSTAEYELGKLIKFIK